MKRGPLVVFSHLAIKLAPQPYPHCSYHNGALLSGGKWRSGSGFGVLSTHSRVEFPGSLRCWLAENLPRSRAGGVASAQRRTYINGRESWGKGRESWGKGRESQGKGRESWGKGFIIEHRDK